MKKSDVVFTVISLILLVFLISFFVLNNKDNTKQENNWNVEIEGEFSYVVYGKYDYTRHSSYGGPRTYEMPVTVIYFIDGRTYVLDDERWNMPYPAGTKLRIWRNGNGKVKIEAIK